MIRLYTQRNTQSAVSLKVHHALIWKKPNSDVQQTKN